MARLKDIITEKTEYYKKFFGKVPDADVHKSISTKKHDIISDYVRELVELTNSSANSADDIAEGIYKGIAGSHRYLQGEFWIVMEKVINKYQDAPSDARNQFSVDMCRAMIKGNNDRLDG